MALTDAKCRAAQPRAKLQKLTDGGGLQLWVQPSGARLWRLAYRFGGKQKVLALGVYPTISLARARRLERMQSACCGWRRPDIGEEAPKAGADRCRHAPRDC